MVVVGCVVGGVGTGAAAGATGGFTPYGCGGGGFGRDGLLTEVLFLKAFHQAGVVGAQAEVDFAADPGVEGGVVLLGGGEGVGVPVGEALGFGDFAAQDDGGHLLDAEFLDAPVGDEGLEVEKAGGEEVGDAAHAAEVVAEGGADFQNVGGGEETAEGGGEGLEADAEQEGGVGGGDLDEGEGVADAFLEGGAGLGVVAEEGGAGEYLFGFEEGLGAVYDEDPAGKVAEGAGVELVGAYGGLVHRYKGTLIFRDEVRGRVFAESYGGWGRFLSRYVIYRYFCGTENLCCKSLRS